MKTGFLKQVLAMMLAIIMVTLPVAEVEAASKPYMETLNISWDLEPDKNVIYKTKYAGIGMHNAGVMITDYKIKPAKKEGYKKLTFTVEFYCHLDFKDVHKIRKSDFFKKNGHTGEIFYTTLVDYNTGMSLGTDNQYGVTVKYGDWDESYYGIECSKDGCGSITVYDYIKRRVTVTYPEDYEGLCIVAGGSTKLVQPANNDKFWDGTVELGKTSYVSEKNKKVTHAMRVID